MDNNAHNSNIYQTGGSLGKDFPTYVRRPADEDIYKNIKSGSFCYILTARQMGKSSLRVQVMHRLQEEGYICISVDLTAFGSGQQTNPNQWYYSFLHKIARSLGIHQKLKDWWDTQTALTPVSRLIDFFEQILLKEVPQNIVIFIDEIDSLLSLDKKEFSTDDFFAAIRYTFHIRPDKPEFRRLNFVILGVASPRDLMSDEARTPFNIGVSIHLSNFTIEESKTLLVGLSHLNTDLNQLLEEVIYWTNGQPYLSQKVCKTLAEYPKEIKNIPLVVARTVKKLFFSHNSNEIDHNLANINKRLRDNERFSNQMLGLYAEILDKGFVKSTNTSEEEIYLKLSGIVEQRNDLLFVANRIYKEKFDADWVKRALQELNRPFTNYIQEWLDFEKEISKLRLKPKVINEIHNWASMQNDLSRLEREFIDSLVVLERKRNQKEKRYLRLMIFSFVSIFIIVTIFASYYIKQQNEKIKSDAEIRDLNSLLKKGNDSLLYASLSKNWALQGKESALVLAEKKQKEAEEERRKANLATQYSNQMNSALRLTSFAQQLIESDPTHAFRIMQKAHDIDSNRIIKEVLYKIYGENLFYKTIIATEFPFIHPTISPTCKYVITESINNTATLWNAQGQSVSKFDCWGILSASIFNKDENEILVGTTSNTAYLWNIQKNTSKKFLWKENRHIVSCNFSPTNKLFITDSDSHFAVVCSAENGKDVLCIDNKNSGKIQCASFIDDEFFITGSDDGTLILWNKKGELIRQFKGHTAAIMSIAISVNKQTIFTGSKDRTAILWNREGQILLNLHGHQQSVLSVAISPNQKFLLTGSWDNTARIWDFDGNEIGILKGHTKGVSEVSFAPDSKHIYTASTDHTVRYWTFDGYCYTILKGHTNFSRAVCFSADGKYVATGATDNTAKIWDTEGNELLTLQHEKSVDAVNFSPDGQYLVTGSSDNTIYLWTLKSRRAIALRGHTERITSTVFSNDGRYILSSSSDKTARLWNLNGDNMVVFRGHDMAVNCVAISPDNKYVLTGSFDKTARLWDMKGKLITTLKGHAFNVNSVAFSKDGKYVYTAAQNEQMVRKWDLKGKQVSVIDWKGKAITKIVISPFANYIFTANDDFTYRIYDIQGDCLQTFSYPQDTPYDVAFSRNGQSFVVTHRNNLCYLWHQKTLLETFLKRNSIQNFNY